MNSNSSRDREKSLIYPGNGEERVNGAKGLCRWAIEAIEGEEKKKEDE